MDLLINIFSFLIGFFLLIKGGGWLVDGATHIAAKLKVPEIIIGLTIVSCGTSLPELIINVLASIEESSEMAIGNIYGSNISNILLILGASCMVGRIPIPKKILQIELPISIFSIIIVWLFANNFDYNELLISRLEGFFLLFLFVGFLSYIYFNFKYGSRTAMEETQDSRKISFRKSILLILLGLVALSFGGKMTVDGGIKLAVFFNVSKEFIGLTLIAIGSSLPELFTSIVATRRGRPSLVMGNIIGSNIFNLLWILGLSSSIYPIEYLETSNIHILVIIGSSAILPLLLILRKDRKLGYKAGFILLLSYGTYMAYLLSQNVEFIPNF